MIEQINIALEQKVREFLSLGHEAQAFETNVRKESIHQLKAMKNASRVLPSEQDDIVNHLITRALQ